MLVLRPVRELQAPDSQPGIASAEDNRAFRDIPAACSPGDTVADTVDSPSAEGNPSASGNPEEDIPVDNRLRGNLAFADTLAELADILGKPRGPSQD